MLKKIGLFHIVPFLLASLIFVFLYHLFISDIIDNHVNIKPLKTTEISGKQEVHAGKYGNLSEVDHAELEFIASIKSKNQLTLMGSSEFTYSKFTTYKYLPAKKNYQVLGIGHAHHQSLSMLIELLAAHPENLNTKIVFFISPGWFNTEGTNSKAFVEYARPNFLNRIINDSTISLEYKEYLGQYIDSRLNEFDGVSKSMTSFMKIFIDNQTNYISLKKLKQNIKDNFKGTISKPIIENINYKLNITNTIKNSTFLNYDSIAKALQLKFISNIQSNSIYVNDNYYNKYLSNKKESILNQPNLKTNEEYLDFKLLLKYVIERKMEASFIILPLNPYYYKNTEVFLPLIDSIKLNLEKHDLPYYNLYVSDTLSYDPGILNDVMHFGDYGWMKVNKYIDSLYYGNH